MYVMHVAGRKKTHKGGHRHFTSEDDLARQQEKARKEREWRVHGHLVLPVDDFGIVHWLPLETVQAAQSRQAMPGWALAGCCMAE